MTTTEVDGIRADLKIAARLLMDDGYSLDNEEAVRIGTALIELAGMLRAVTDRLVNDEKERGGSR